MLKETSEAAAGPNKAIVSVAATPPSNKFKKNSEILTDF
jgi:hypothetical protein